MQKHLVLLALVFVSSLLPAQNNNIIPQPVAFTYTRSLPFKLTAATPPCSNHAPRTTHPPPITIQITLGAAVINPKYHEAIHMPAQTTAAPMEAKEPPRFNLDHSHAPAAINATVTNPKTCTAGWKTAGSNIANNTIAVMIRCLSI